MAIASSLLQAIKKCRQACPSKIKMCFSQGSIPESLVNKKSKLTVIQHLLKVTTPKEYKKYMVLTNVFIFVNFELFFTKLSGIDPYEKRIDYPGGYDWGHVFMACSKLEAMAIYLVKQACGNDILLASV